MKIMNFLFAVENTAGDVRLFQNLKNKLVAEINRQEYCQVGYFDFVFTKEALIEKMKGNAYDVVLCNEALGADKIGVGSLRQWKEEFPHIRVILLIGNARKGNIKLIQLIQKLEYTDVLYMGDTNGENICKLLEKPRSLKDAVYYYGIEDSEEILSMGIMEDSEAAVTEESVVGEQSTFEEAQKEVVVEETENVKMPEGEIAQEESSAISLEDAIKEYENFSEFEEEVEEPKEEVVEDSSFHFDLPVEEEAVPEESVEIETSESTDEEFNFFDTSYEDRENDVVSYKEVTKEQKPLEEMKEEKDSDDGDEPEPELINVEFEEDTESEVITELVEKAVIETVKEKEVSEPEDIFKMPYMENVSQGGVIMRTQSEQILSATGYITKVVDEDSLLLELDTDGLKNEELQSYRLMLRIKSGRKGIMENGRYRSANLSLEAYVECMVGKKTAMVEVMDFDCITNAPILENKDCTIILTKI